MDVTIIGEFDGLSDPATGAVQIAEHCPGSDIMFGLVLKGGFEVPAVGIERIGNSEEEAIGANVSLLHQPFNRLYPSKPDPETRGHGMA